MEYLNHLDATYIYQLQAGEKKIPKNLMHYTSTEVLDILLKKCTFRATNVFYLNDAMEYKKGIEELYKQLENAGVEILDKIKNENGTGIFNRGIYTISFSQEKDSLYQWITYAKESGIAIELDDDLIMSMKDHLWYGIESFNHDNDTLSSYEKLLFTALRLALQPVIYNYKDALLQIHEFKDDCIEKYMWYASYFKQNGFEAENEVRLSVFATKNEYGKQGEVKYYSIPNKGFLRPYIDVTFGYYNTKDLQKIFKPCLPLKSITIGPSGRQQAVFNSVVHRVKYGEMNVYNYSLDREKLITNLASYISEMFYWLERKEYKNNFEEASRTIDNAELYIGSKSINESSTLICDVKKLLCLKKGCQYQDFDDKLKSQYWDYIINNLLSCWINKNIDYLLELKDETGNKVYHKDYLSYEFNEKSNSAIFDLIIQEFNEDFYFSKEGILIKKSIIPYIF